MKKNIFKNFLFKYRTTDIRLKLRDVNALKVSYSTQKGAE